MKVALITLLSMNFLTADSHLMYCCTAIPNAYLKTVSNLPVCCCVTKVQVVDAKMVSPG